MKRDVKKNALYPRANPAVAASYYFLEKNEKPYKSLKEIDIPQSVYKRRCEIKNRKKKK